jgi:para-aminobenzoate synthetase/4-amino-4-deoxychorismate lyase
MQIYSDKIFDKPIEIIEVLKPTDLKNGFERLEELRKQGLYLLGYVRYDLKEIPLMYFEAYKSYSKYRPKNTDKNIGIFAKPLISKEEYIKKVNYIKQLIKNGITYEVNYTYPSEVYTTSSDLELYEHLLKRQQTPYNAFIKNKYETVLSFSPELFFKLKSNNILTKPMKGTAPRGETVEEDIKNKEFLFNDKKNRAENIMIVDLLRNDLGRISKTGTVKVDKLFEIETHPTVFQMTSEISAELQEGTTLYDIFKAIYPCGSITGAPKTSTMKVIEETEPFSREMYCGAIGYLHKDEVIFSVPIRILYKKSNNNSFRYHAGGAIVWDSNPDEEWEETLTKTKFLQTDFSIIETALSDWDLHVARMKNSAKFFNFIWNKGIENLKLKENKVLRVALHKNGDFDFEYKEIPNSTKPLKIKISRRVNSSNVFLYHKTTIRENMPTDTFEEIAINERGEITEGVFTNIGILKNGKYYTPPVKSGLLNGICRTKLNWEEKVLFPEDIKSADKIFCFNSVRGVVEVELC